MKLVKVLTLRCSLKLNATFYECNFHKLRVNYKCEQGTMHHFIQAIGLVKCWKWSLKGQLERFILVISQLDAQNFVL